MKILVVSNKFPYPPKDGGAIATFSMIKGLHATGNQMTVASINTSKHYTDPASIPDDVKNIAHFVSTKVDTRLSVWQGLRNLLFSKHPYTATRFYSEEFNTTLCSILSQNTFDVVQLEGLYVCQYIPTIKKYSQATIAYRAHNVEFEIWDRLWKETNFFLKKWYLKNLAKRVKQYELSYINAYDVLLPITKRDGDFYTQLGNSKPQHVVPTGVFQEQLQPVKQHPQTISLFHIGGLDWAPNQQGILWFIQECWPHIYNQHPHLRFVIAGRNAPNHFLTKIQVPGIEYVGEVADARKFMEENSIMIVPLLAGSGMRIKIIEGLAYGKAIVSTPIGAEGIAAEHTREICIAQSSKEFIDCVLLLIKNNDLRSSIEKNAINFVARNFNTISITNSLIDFYKTHVHTH